MSTFPLRILTPSGVAFQGDARQLTLRTTEGAMTVLPRHAPFAAALGEGNAVLVDAQGNRREAICKGGIITILSGQVTVISDHFAWTQEMA